MKISTTFVLDFKIIWTGTTARHCREYDATKRNKVWISHRRMFLQITSLLDLYSDKTFLIRFEYFSKRSYHSAERSSNRIPNNLIGTGNKVMQYQSWITIQWKWNLHSQLSIIRISFTVFVVMRLALWILTLHRKISLFASRPLWNLQGIPL